MNVVLFRKLQVANFATNHYKVLSLLQEDTFKENRRFCLCASNLKWLIKNDTCNVSVPVCR